MASETADGLLRLFTGRDDGVLWSTGHDAPALIARIKEIVDGTAPSANGTAACALARLGSLTGDERYRAAAEMIVAAGTPAIRQAPARFASIVQAAGLLAGGTMRITVPPGRPDLAAAVHRHYLPEAVLAPGQPGGAAVVCRAGMCYPPVSDAESLVRTLTMPAGTDATRRAG